MLTSRPSWKKSQGYVVCRGSLPKYSHDPSEYDFKNEVQKMNELSSATGMSPPRIESCQSQHWYRLVANTEPLSSTILQKLQTPGKQSFIDEMSFYPEESHDYSKRKLVTRDRKLANAGLRFGQFESITRHTWLSFFWRNRWLDNEH